MEFATHLEADQLALRPLAIDDAKFFDQLLSDAHVRAFLGGPVPEAQRIARFDAYLRGAKGVGIWLVCKSLDQEPIGLITLNQHQDGTNYEISYEFHPDCWGKGFAREAVNRVLQHALEDTALTEVIAETQKAHHASVRLLRTVRMIEIEQLERYGAQQLIFITEPDRCSEP